MRGLVVLCAVCAPVCAVAQGAMTAAEKTSLGKQISACWSAPLDTPVFTIRFSLDRDGRPDADSVKLLSQGNGAADARETAFAAARRAVLRCGRDGYELAVEKYEQWRDIELTFDPERTSLR